MAQEEVGIRLVVDLAKEVIQADLVLARDLWNVINGTVQCTEAKGSDSRGVASLRRRQLSGGGSLVQAGGVSISSCRSCFTYGLNSAPASLGPEERIGWLNGVDVLMQMRWQ